MPKRDRAVLTTGPVAPMLARLSLPMLMGMAGMVVFNLADTFFIGKLGKLELAALSFTFPVVMVVSSVAHGIGMGTSAVLSRAIGRREERKVRRIATDSLLLAVCAVAFFVIIGELTLEPLFYLLGADEAVMPIIVEYMRVWYVGVIFVVIPMVGNNAIRATGDMLTPGIIMTVAAALNLVLDPLLIFGLGPFPALGVFGGALATVIARGLTLPVALYVLIVRERIVTLERPTLAEVMSSWRQVLRIAVPAAGTNLITPLSAGFLTRIVAGFGHAAVAGFGVATRVEMLVLMPVMALASVLVPFTGQNWGSGKMPRVKTATRHAYVFSFGWGTIAALAFLFVGEGMASVFNDDPGVASAAGSYLTIVSFSYCLQGTLLLSSSALNALDRPGTSIALSFLRSIILAVPLAYLGAHLLGLEGVFAAALAANAVAGTLGMVLTAKRITGDNAVLAEGR